MSTAMIEVERLRHVYGSRLALDDVSFTVGRGEVFGLLGPNGGGKTTLFKILATLMRPSGGEAIVGREAILASFLARPPRVQRHVIANVVVEAEDEDHAGSFCAILLYQGDPVSDGLPEMSANSPLVGWFRDKLVRTGEGWRFAERVGGLDFRP